MLISRKDNYAVILFNLGGPDSLVAVKPFLFNLFYDSAILQIPNPLRWLLAKLISTFRAAKAKSIYQQIGGKSPLLLETQKQACALEEKFKLLNLKVWSVMRYWHPRAHDVVKDVREFNPKKIILIPLYPQFSTTTTASSINEWLSLTKNLKNITEIVYSYPTQKHFIMAHQKLLEPFLIQAKKYGNAMILFSAHGLPQKIIDKGDPYKKQIEQSVEKIMAAFPDVDHLICYQSKVGLKKWLKPSLDTTIFDCAQAKRSVIIVPISFVSEHSETLVELDIEYRNKAEALGIPYYGRVPALSCHPDFIMCLQKLVMDHI